MGSVAWHTLHQGMPMLLLLVADLLLDFGPLDTLELLLPLEVVDLQLVAALQVKRRMKKLLKVSWRNMCIQEQGPAMGPWHCARDMWQCVEGPAMGPLSQRHVPLCRGTSNGPILWVTCSRGTSNGPMDEFRHMSLSFACYPRLLWGIWGVFWEAWQELADSACHAASMQLKG